MEFKENHDLTYRELENLKKVSCYDLEDWFKLYKFDLKFKVFSPKDRQNLYNILVRFKNKLELTEVNYLYGENCVKKAIEKGYELYRLNNDEFKKIVEYAENYNIVPFKDLNFLRKVLRNFNKIKFLSEDYILKSNEIFFKIKKTGYPNEKIVITNLENTEELKNRLKTSYENKKINIKSLEEKQQENESVNSDKDIPDEIMDILF